MKDVAHFFLHRDFFRQIWMVVFDCLGFVMVTLLRISDHLDQFGPLTDSLNTSAKYNILQEKK